MHQLYYQDFFPIFHLSYNFTTKVFLQDTSTSYFKNKFISEYALPQPSVLADIAPLATEIYQSIETKNKYLDVIYEDTVDATVLNELHFLKVLPQVFN